MRANRLKMATIQQTYRRKLRCILSSCYVWLWWRRCSVCFAVCSWKTCRRCWRWCRPRCSRKLLRLLLLRVQQQGRQANWVRRHQASHLHHRSQHASLRSKVGVVCGVFVLNFERKMVAINAAQPWQFFLLIFDVVFLVSLHVSHFPLFRHLRIHVLWISRHLFVSDFQ